MNKTRRKAISKIVDQLTEISDELENIQNEEEEAYENLPENLQCSRIADDMSGYIDLLSDATQNINDARDYLEEITQ